jgi:hypothetical protein
MDIESSKTHEILVATELKPPGDKRFVIELRFPGESWKADSAWDVARDAVEHVESILGYKTGFARIYDSKLRDSRPIYQAYSKPKARKSLDDQGKQIVQDVLDNVINR